MSRNLLKKDEATVAVVDSNGDRDNEDIIINNDMKTKNQVFDTSSLVFLFFFLPEQRFNHVSI
jgi:hypothetical protein